jgi:hypothetical protein
MKLKTNLKLRNWLLNLSNEKIERFSELLWMFIVGVISLYFLFYFILAKNYQCALLVVVIRALWRIEKLLKSKVSDGRKNGEN